MLITASITEKHIGSKLLFRDLHLVLPERMKVGLIGRNGVGKSTLFRVLTGEDTDFVGSVTRKRGLRITATAQEHADVEESTALEYVLQHVPDYNALKEIIDTYPETLGEDLERIHTYTDALQAFVDHDYYNLEYQVLATLDRFGIDMDAALRPLRTLSGGQKRFMEMVRVAFSGAELILLDEPTNHLDYHGKELFTEWLRETRATTCIITHDRDVLEEVDLIVEIRDYQAFSYSGKYSTYIRQNSTDTLTHVRQYEVALKQMEMLEKQIQAAAARKGKASANPSRVLEERLQREYDALKERTEKPSFWIDRASSAELEEEIREGYDRYKARTINIGVNTQNGHARQLMVVEGLSVGYDRPLFEPLSFSLRHGDRLMLHGRNGAGKSTLIQALLGATGGAETDVLTFRGLVRAWTDLRIGVYRQEVPVEYLPLSLEAALESVYHAAGRPFTEQILSRLLANYLFDPIQDRALPLRFLSGGQKARFQLIRMLCADPNLLVLDEPTNHLDLPSIEELEDALGQYHGAILYVSHDRLFTERLGGQAVQVGEC